MFVALLFIDKAGGGGICVAEEVFKGWKKWLKISAGDNAMLAARERPKNPKACM